MSAKYPDYNHEVMVDYFQNKLSKDEQSQLLDASTSYADMFENTYKKHLESNTANIDTKNAPNIPNVNNSRKENVTPSEISEGTQSHDEQLKQALGL